MSRSRISDEQAEAMYAMYLAGSSMTEVSRAFHCHAQYLFQSRGYKVRTRQEGLKLIASQRPTGFAVREMHAKALAARTHFNPWNKGAVMGACTRCGKERRLVAYGEGKGLCKACARTIQVQGDPQKREAARIRNAKYTRTQKARATNSEWRYGGNYNAAMNKTNGKCWVCGAIAKRVHHRDGKGENLPLSQRNNTLENLVPLCESCHKTLHWKVKTGMTHEEALIHLEERRREARRASEFENAMERR